jgi:hypothetical protein
MLRKTAMTLTIAAIGLMTGPAWSAIVVEDKDSAYADDPTFASFDTTGADKIVVALTDEAFRENYATAVTFDGVGLTEVAGARNHNGQAQITQIWYVDWNGSAATTGDLVITGLNAAYGASIVALSGTVAGGPVNSGIADATSISFDPTSDGAFVMATFSQNGDNANIGTNAPLTELGVFPTNNGGASGASGYGIFDSSSQNFSFDAQNSRPAISIASFAAEIPEPASLATGLLGLTLIIARRRKA